MKFVSLVPVLILGSPLFAQNSALSVHLSTDFPSSDAILKMQKVMIVQSAGAEYFEVNYFNNGYAGLQQTTNTIYANPDIFISSLWDINTAENILASVDYSDPTTTTDRFGGEGNGWQGLTTYDWVIGRWYNVVQRAWNDTQGNTYFATFVNDTVTGNWLHTVTFSNQADGSYLYSHNDAFLENWDGSNPAWNGSLVRQAYFKDSWIMDLAGNWEAPTSVYFSANSSAADQADTGPYYGAFNAAYDATQDAYLITHGGSTTPSLAFGGNRTLNLQLQTGQGASPTVGTLALTAFGASADQTDIYANWTIGATQPPQFSARFDLLDGSGNVLATTSAVDPEVRSLKIGNAGWAASVMARLTLVDLFNHQVISNLVPVSVPSPAGRLINISARAQVGTGSNGLIPGFVITGSGMETLLIRADGPSLALFGVTGVLAQPSLSVIDQSGAVLASNTGWGNNPDPAEIASVASSVGAFALPSGSADCAVVVELPAGQYTVAVSGFGNTQGVALAEIYEVSTTGTRLINISTRAQVGTGSGILIPGFVVGGTTGAEQLLVRADGPILAAFGVTGVLAQPSLAVTAQANGDVIASNTGWGTAANSSAIASTASAVGAFALPQASADSAAIVSLPPGSYTMQVSGVGGTTGVALAEAFEVSGN